MCAAKKNIILISLDDCIAYWKHKTAFNEPLYTPNLDRICGQATAFHSAYCQAPICGPSRASFMSGKTPAELDIFDNHVDIFDRIDAREIWSCRLKDAGFYCSSGGKMHHRFKPVRRRYHNVIYSDNQKVFSADMHMPPDLEKKKFGGNRGGWGTTDTKDDGTYYDFQSADSAIKFLETYDQDAPFYREVGFYSPHGPHYTPVRFKEMYNQRNFKQPEEWAGGFDENGFMAECQPENPELKEKNNNWWRFSVRNYFSALSHGDYHLGRVWDALQASSHARNTIVVILSDHGFHLGNRNRYRKSTLWEQSAGVPIIVYDPDQPLGQEIHDPVALLDIGPTILDYAGLPALENCVGQSLVPYLTGYGEPDRSVPTFHHQGTAIRKGDYRFIQFQDGSTQLFNLKDDYWQLKDLGDTHPAYDAMRASLNECSKKYGLTIPEQ